MEAIDEKFWLPYSTRKSLRISIIYFIISLIWIFGSDKLVMSYYSDKTELELISMIKGWFFVICSSALIYFLVRRAINAIQLQQKNLELNRAKLKYLFDWASDGIFISDQNKKYIDVNHYGCKMLGYTREEIIGMNISDIVIFENVSEPLLNNKLEKGEARISEQKMRKKDGSLIHVEISEGILPNGNLQAIVRDITERKLIEEELKEKDQLLVETGKIAKVGGWEFDTTTLKGKWTPEVARIHDLDPEQETNVELGVSFFHGENRERIVQAIREAVEFGKPYDMELELISALGKQKWVRTIGKPIKDGDNVVKVRGSFQDITERKEAEIELIKSREQYRSLFAHLQTIREEERASIAREMHDELGQILTSLKMKLSLVYRNIDDKTKKLDCYQIGKELRSTISMIDNAVKRVRKLITQLRPELLDKLGLLAALEWYVQEFTENTKIECEFSTSSEELIIPKETELAVFRIVQEALTNTAKHSGASKASISVTENVNELIVEIKDNGSGITEEKLKGDKSFGLMGMRERADLIGASLNIYGELNKGTTTKLVIKN